MKLGHLLESARNTAQYHEMMMKVAAKSFRYKKVSRMPDDHARWQRNARNVLEKRRRCLFKKTRDVAGYTGQPLGIIEPWDNLEGENGS